MIWGRAIMFPLIWGQRLATERKLGIGKVLAEEILTWWTIPIDLVCVVAVAWIEQCMEKCKTKVKPCVRLEV